LKKVSGQLHFVNMAPVLHYILTNIGVGLSEVCWEACACVCVYTCCCWCVMYEDRFALSWSVTFVLSWDDLTSPAAYSRWGHMFWWL